MKGPLSMFRADLASMGRRAEPQSKLVMLLQVYVSGRKRPQGEMNGKSGNLNNCGSQIYPPGTDIPLNEVMCIFDADQVAKRDFFLRTLPFFDGGDDVGMVLSPQVNPIPVP